VSGVVARNELTMKNGNKAPKTHEFVTKLSDKDVRKVSNVPKPK
jgi:hypothetical protein